VVLLHVDPSGNAALTILRRPPEALGAERRQTHEEGRRRIGAGGRMGASTCPESHSGTGRTQGGARVPGRVQPAHARRPLFLTRTCPLPAPREHSKRGVRGKPGKRPCRARTYSGGGATRTQGRSEGET
jgi:hypothetical protein